MTERTLYVNSRASLAEATRALEQEWYEGKVIEVIIKRRAGRRTGQQNKALHVFCGLLAQTLNDSGYDMRRTLRHDVEVPWTAQAVKEYMWRPVQIAVLGVESTTDMTTQDPTEVHQVLARHLASRLGVICPPWPSRDEPENQDE